MSTLRLGHTPSAAVVSIVRNSAQSFGVAWTNEAGAPADLTGNSVVISLDSGLEWVASNDLATGVSSWVLSATDTNLPSGTMEGRMVLRGTGDDVVIFFITVVISK
jgi:hypothetical protein